MNNVVDKRIVIKKFQKSKRKDSLWYTMKCLNCGKEFNIIGRDYNRGRGIYCSDKCNKQRKSGKYNGRWNGGIKYPRGYKFIHKDLVEEEYHYLITHNFYIPEHRLIAAKKYKRKLKTKDIVHHLNGFKNDNRPENLIIVDSSTHEKHTFEKRLQERIRKLEKLLNK